MTRIILKSLTLCLLSMFKPVHAQEIWRESFSVPGKGIMGDEYGNVLIDFTGVNSWSLEYPFVEFADPGDYAKTVSTSGGRFEACDLNGEIVWRSEWINITGQENVIVELITAETGSGTNTGTKYMNIFYRVDEGDELLFNDNGANSGNWGSLKARQEGINGNILQIVCYISTHYAADKVILDEVTVWNEPVPLPPVNPSDVVINEIMTDPYPPVGLPEAEYIELYNTRDFPVRTENWQLRINGVAKKLQDMFIEPGEYLLLCATGSVDSLKPYGAVSNISGFQGLLNKGAVVEILNGEDYVIDRIAYANTWYCDDQKTDGGWSLERIDPFRKCNQPGNWKASMHANGGTPGCRNSVFAENKDETPPFVKWTVAVSLNEVEIVFSEPIDTVLLNNAANYFIKELGNPVQIELITDRQVILHFSKTLQKDEIYSLNIIHLVDECSNIMSDQSWEIQWNCIDPGDVLINEVLFDPYPGGEDYIEIYNPSGKMIDLSRLLLTNRNKEQELNQVLELTKERRILFPGDYLALTKDTNSVFPWYSIQCPYCFLQMNRIPAFPNDEGWVVLLNKDMTIIDELSYSEKMHSPFLSDTEGISLERVSFSAATNTLGNWHSAAGDAGYATPGYQNSLAENGLEGKPVVYFETESFSPNYDGYNDEYIIHYELAKPGYVTNIKIFDVKGRFLHHYLMNETLGTSGKIVWNGEDETGRLLPMGIYVVVMELFNSEGEIYRFKDGVVLTGVMD